MRFLIFLLAVFSLPLMLSACHPTPSSLAPGIKATTSVESAKTVKADSDTPKPAITDLQTDDTVLDLANGPSSSVRVLSRPSAVIRDDVTDLLEGLPSGAHAAFVVIDLEGDQEIAAHNADKALIPASTMKLATALVALDVLGPNHRYRTELRSTGPVVNGLLDGDLYLKGGGDPLLDIADFIALARDLKARGIQEISGRFLIDDTALPSLTEIEPRQPSEAAYNPGVSALSLAFNRVHLSWKGNAETGVATVPFLDEAWFENEARNRLPPSGVQLKEHKDGRVLWQLADRGTRRSKRALPVKDPGLHAGHVFTNIAAMYGITLPDPTRASLPSETQVAAVHRSRPLRELVRDMLWYSNNLMAELIGLSIARESASNPESLAFSAEILIGHLARMIPEIDWSEAIIDNHSGLDNGARMTPKHLVAILKKGWQNGTLVDLLPVSGWSGTLTRRFTEQDEALRVWAKTGSLNYADGLAGFMLSSTHGPAAFAILVSDLEARASYDALPRRTRETEASADRWHKDVQKVIDRLIADWLTPSSTRTAAYSP